MEKSEHLKIDPTFYDRAGTHVYLSTSPLSNINSGKVSAAVSTFQESLPVGNSFQQNTDAVSESGGEGTDKKGFEAGAQPSGR